MSKTQILTHGIAFLLGVATGVTVVTKGCPPAPAPAGQPSKEEVLPKVEAKSETKEEAKTADAPKAPEAKQEIKAESK